LDYLNKIIPEFKRDMCNNPIDLTKTKIKIAERHEVQMHLKHYPNH